MKDIYNDQCCACFCFSPFLLLLGCICIGLNCTRMYDDTRFIVDRLLDECIDTCPLLYSLSSRCTSSTFDWLSNLDVLPPYHDPTTNVTYTMGRIIYGRLYPTDQLIDTSTSHTILMELDAVHSAYQAMLNDTYTNTITNITTFYPRFSTPLPSSTTTSFSEYVSSLRRSRSSFMGDDMADRDMTTHMEMFLQRYEHHPT